MKKTNYMLNTPNTNKQIDINIRDIERKSCIKYVGMYLVEHFNWNSQIAHVKNKLAKKI